MHASSHLVAHSVVLTTDYRKQSIQMIHNRDRAAALEEVPMRKQGANNTKSCPVQSNFISLAL